MKTIKLLAALLFSGMIAIGQNGASMEFKYSSSKGTSGTMLLKHSEYGSKSEINMKSAKGPNGMVMSSLIKKSNPDIIYMINESNKTYSEMKKSATNGNQEDKHTYTVKKIGNETINGYKCIHSTVTNEKNQVTEMWTSKDIIDFGKYSDALNNDKNFGSNKRDQAIKAAGCDGFPVKMVQKSKDNEGDVTMELVKFEKKSFSKSDFEIPSGYSKAAGMTPGAIPGIKTQDELMKMTPEERAKYVEELKKMYGK